MTLISIIYITPHPPLLLFNRLRSKIKTRRIVYSNTPMHPILGAYSSLSSSSSSSSSSSIYSAAIEDPRPSPSPSLPPFNSTETSLFIASHAPSPPWPSTRVHFPIPFRLVGLGSFAGEREAEGVGRDPHQGKQLHVGQHRDQDDQPWVWGETFYKHDQFGRSFPFV